ncbi:hypothetical protein LPJ64_001501 [Coemansia asiatica]|uniref:Uncharacterized protein n=1 Tax=Coemansia asiatica TaxID=1052880 RepID=A0A9W8CKK6_9FUNG|nr:hypothetical protein LPJ64_001501 [Coemansia asiatica]
MAKRLRARLMQARAEIEKDIGHSLAIAMPCPDREIRIDRPHSSPSSPTPRPARRGLAKRPLARGLRFPQTQPHALGVCAHSRPHKDHSLPRASSLSHGSPAHIRSPAHRLTLAKKDASRSYMDLPSSPPIARTPPKRDINRNGKIDAKFSCHSRDSDNESDNDNEIAHTILMLATPPAPRSHVFFEPDSSHRLDLLDTTPTPSNRRLSFSRCIRKPLTSTQQQDSSDQAANCDASENALNRNGQPILPTRLLDTQQLDKTASIPLRTQPLPATMSLRSRSASRSRSRSRTEPKSESVSVSESASASASASASLPTKPAQKLIKTTSHSSTIK